MRHLGIDLGTASVKLLRLGEDGHDVSVSRPVNAVPKVLNAMEPR